MQTTIMEVHNKHLPVYRVMNLITKNYYSLLSIALKQYELERDFRVLVYLDEQGHPCSQMEIGTALGIDKVSFVRVIRGLEMKGYIVRLTNKKDRREKRISLTCKSRFILPWIYADIEQLNHKTFEGIPGEEVNKLRGYFDQMVSNTTKYMKS